jgi:hypothetical protein
MSVLTTLALLMLPGALKAKLEHNREAELAAEIVGLKIDLADARRDRDDWRVRAEAWRERALANIPAVALPQPAGPDFRPPHIARRQDMAAQQQQAQAMQGGLAQYAQAAQQDYGLAQMQAQALQNPNCAPSRSQVWAANEPEA